MGVLERREGGRWVVFRQGRRKVGALERRELSSLERRKERGRWVILREGRREGGGCS